MILWTFNIRKSEAPDPKTGSPFVYDDSDAGFTGEVRAICLITAYAITDVLLSSQLVHLSFPLCLNLDRSNTLKLLDKSGMIARRI